MILKRNSDNSKKAIIYNAYHARNVFRNKYYYPIINNKNLKCLQFV